MPCMTDVPTASKHSRRASLRPLWHWRTLTGLALGGAGGALYATYIGCTTGGCAITSSPLLAGLFGALLGASLLMPARPAPRP